MNNDPRSAGGIFVGRAHELEALRADVDHTLAGRGRLILLEGEPGIGKTSIAQEVATYARLAGAQVVWGRCDDVGGAPPYWPWVQAIRSYLQSSASNVAVAESSRLADIAKLVPEVVGAPSAVPAPLPVAPDEDRFRLFDSITNFLRDAAQHRALLLIIDDLHAADAPSLLLLQFLARQLAETHLMVIAAYRDVDVDRHHPLFRALGDLVREPTTRRVTLRGLSEVEVGRYIELSVDTSAPALAAAVYRETDGNPFFIGEVVRLLVSEGQLRTFDGDEARPFELPRGVREAIGRRLDRLSPACREVLRLAAVVGRDFHIDLLQRTGDTPAEPLAPMLEQATAARILTEVPASIGRYSFSHGLIRETLYTELTATERVRLHRRVAETLEVVYRARSESHLAELARHFFEAAQGGGDEKALHYALRAADHAARQMAHEEAIRHYEMALQILDGIGTADGASVVDVLLLLSDAAWRAGEIDKAKHAALRAIDVARDLGAAEQLARAVLGFAGRLPVSGAVFPNPEVIGFLSETLQMLDDRDTPLRALIMARLAEEQTLGESHEERWALSRQAVEMARRLDDPMILATALKCTFFAHWDPLQLDERLAAGDEIIKLADRARDRTLGLEGHMCRFIGLVEKGEAAAAQQELDLCEPVAKALRQPYHEFVVAVMCGCLAAMQGRLGEIEQLAQHALALGHRARALNTSMFCGVQLHRLMWLQGRFQELEPLVLGVVAAHPLVDASNRAALAITYAEQGRLHDARTQFEIAAAHDFTDIPRHLGWQFTMAHLAEVCGALGDRPRAEQLYALLRPLDGRNLLMPLLTVVGPAAYYLGLLATVLGRLEVAERHFEDALRFDARTGARQQRARTQLAYGDMLLAKGCGSDADRAFAHVEEARQIGIELGMQRLVQRADDLTAKYRERVGFASTPSLGSPETVSPTTLSQDPMDQGTAALRQEGEYWTLAHGNTVLRFKNAKGFHYLAQLLRVPGRELHALELISAGAALEPTPIARSQGELRTSTLTGTDPLLDRTAKQQYKHRVAGLFEQLKEAESFNDMGRAAALRSEIEAISQQLAAAVGLGGRDRKARSSAERARWAVTKGIKGAVTKIRRGDPQLGRHLASHVHTGYVCSYEPDPDRPIRWIL